MFSEHKPRARGARRAASARPPRIDGAWGQRELRWARPAGPLRAGRREATAAAFAGSGGRRGLCVERRRGFVESRGGAACTEKRPAQMRARCTGSGERSTRVEQRWSTRMLGFRRSSPHPHNLSDLDVIIGNGYLPQQLSSLITQISTPPIDFAV